jgi:hypothetical protein
MEVEMLRMMVVLIIVVRTICFGSEALAGESGGAYAANDPSDAPYVTHQGSGLVTNTDSAASHYVVASLGAETENPPVGWARTFYVYNNGGLLECWIDLYNLGTHQHYWVSKSTNVVGYTTLSIDNGPSGAPAGQYAATGICLLPPYSPTNHYADLFGSW